MVNRETLQKLFGAFHVIDRQRKELESVLEQLDNGDTTAYVTTKVDVDIAQIRAGAAFADYLAALNKFMEIA